MIIVTGATGHIGNVVVKQLVAQGKEVGIITHSRSPEDILAGFPVKVFQGSTTDPGFLTSVFKGAEAVIHLAAKISIQSGEYAQLYETNVVGTRNVMQSALLVKVPKVVYVSSVHALLEQPNGQVITEIVPTDANMVLGDYAKSKVLAYHEVMQAYHDGLDVSIVFPAGVIGPFDYKPSQIGQVEKNFIAGKKNYYIDGKYNYVDVRDVAKGIITALVKGQPGEGYALTGYEITVADMYKLISESIGGKLSLAKIPSFVAYPLSFVAEFFAKIFKKPALFTPYSFKVLQSNCNFSNEKAKSELGFNPRSLKDSLTDAIHWHQGQTVSIV